MKYLFYSLFSVFLFASCVSDDFSAGNNLISVKGRTIILEDCSVELETQLGDSSVTSGLSRIFEGKYNSSDFGIITAHSYFDFNPPTYSISEFGTDVNVKVRFDSISLILKYDNFNYGDTTQVQTLNIYKLKQIIELNDKGVLYSTSSVQSEKEAWVTYKFDRPTESYENDSLLEIRLPDAFGLELIKLMNEQSEHLNTYENFQRYFNGIKLSPGATDNAAVNSFILDEEYPTIRLYYTTIGAITEEKSLDLQANTTNAFSQIEVDRSNTPLRSLNYHNNSLSSTEADNKIYLQGLTGLYAKLRFPDLNEILKLGDFVVISQAYLYVYPAKGTYNYFTPLPANLSLNYLDENGKAMDVYVDQSTTAVQSGVLVEDDVYDENTYYAFDITSYLQYEIGLMGIYKTSLQLYLNDSEKNNTLKSLVFGDQSISDNNSRIRLRIYAIVYNND